MNVPSDHGSASASRVGSDGEFESVGPLHFKRREVVTPFRERPHRGKRGRLAAWASVGIIILLACAYLAYAYDTNGAPLFGTAANSTVQSTHSSQSSVSQFVATTSSASVSTIDAAWVSQFFALVNDYRQTHGLPTLSESAVLDQFSAKRFATASSNYQISHYGYDNDASCFFVNCIPYSDLGGSTYVYNQNALGNVLNQGAYYQLPAGYQGSYWPIEIGQQTVYFTTESAISTYITQTYGQYTTVNFDSGGAFTVQFPQFPAEEILYPDGYTPSAYINYTQVDAPIHWQGFLDPSLHTYGFYLGQGTTYAVYQPCSVTEIPGPNINIPQYYTQNGCQYTTVPSTWLVIDMS